MKIKEKKELEDLEILKTKKAVATYNREPYLIVWSIIAT